MWIRHMHFFKPSQVFHMNFSGLTHTNNKYVLTANHTSQNAWIKVSVQRHTQNMKHHSHPLLGYEACFSKTLGHGSFVTVHVHADRICFPVTSCLRPHLSLSSYRFTDKTLQRQHLEGHLPKLTWTLKQPVWSLIPDFSIHTSISYFQLQRSAARSQNDAFLLHRL